MFKRPLRLHSATNVPSATVETPAEMTMDQHGLPPAGWDRIPAGQQGGRRAAYRNAIEPVQFKSAGGPGAVIIKRGR